MISYANMKLKPVNTTHDLLFNESITIKISDYLPIEDKYDLIMVTLQKSFENGYYNPLKMDMYFHLNLIYLYTDINFTEKQREDENKIYDTLKSNGILDAFLKDFDENEYNELLTLLEETKKEIMHYKCSTSALLQSVITDLPKQAEAVQKIIDNFDQEKYQNVINFAKAANGRSWYKLMANLN